MSIVAWLKRLKRQRLDDEDFQEEICAHLVLAAIGTYGLGPTSRNQPGRSSHDAAAVSKMSPRPGENPEDWR